MRKFYGIAVRKACTHLKRFNIGRMCAQNVKQFNIVNIDARRYIKYAPPELEWSKNRCSHKTESEKNIYSIKAANEWFEEPYSFIQLIHSNDQHRQKYFCFARTAAAAAAKSSAKRLEWVRASLT